LSKTRSSGLTSTAATYADDPRCVERRTCALPKVGTGGRPIELADARDDNQSPRRRRRDDCIAGAMRESMQQLDVRVEVHQHCFQRQSISGGRAIQCLPTFARMTGSKRRRTHVPRRRRSMGATVRGLPRRADAVPKAGVRRPDPGRMLRHDLDRQSQPGRAIAFARKEGPAARRASTDASPGIASA